MKTFFALFTLFVLIGNVKAQEPRELDIDCALYNHAAICTITNMTDRNLVCKIDFKAIPREGFDYSAPEKEGRKVEICKKGLRWNSFKEGFVNELGYENIESDYLCVEPVDRPYKCDQSNRL